MTTRAPGDLAGIAALRRLEPAALARIAAACRFETHATGAPVIRHQDGDRDLLMLLEGRARACVYAPGGQPVSFRDLTAGDLFGELSAIDGAPRSAYVEALTPVRVARLPANRLAGLLTAEPGLAAALLVHVTALVRDLSERLVAVSSQKADQRIRGELLRRAVETGQRGPRVTLSPAPHQAELAARVGTQREAVSREFGRLAKIGLVRRQGADLVIPDIDALRAHWAEGQGD